MDIHSYMALYTCTCVCTSYLQALGTGTCCVNYFVCIFAIAVVVFAVAKHPQLNEQVCLRVTAKQCALTHAYIILVTHTHTQHAPHPEFCFYSNAFNYCSLKAFRI